MASGGFRLRITYRKADRLMFLSHLEVTRALERSLRRAELPYAVTQGFTPRMKIAFGPALPTGTAGERELFEVWLRQHVPASEALDRLARASADLLAPVHAVYVGEREPSLVASHTRSVYETVVTGGVDAAGVAAAIEALVAEGVLSVDHKGRTKTFDLGACLAGPVAIETDSARGVVVRLQIDASEQGSLRPEAFVSAALDAAGVRGVRLTTARTDLADPTVGDEVAAVQ